MLLVAGAALLWFGIGSALTAAAPKYSDWSAPVNLGSTLNTSGGEGGAAPSKDGLSLYFQSDRAGGSGLADIWVSQRESPDQPWGPPVNLGPTVNSASTDQTTTLSRDGHWLFFASNRPGGFGGFDIWASWRPQTHDDFGWQTPINLGAGVNSALSDLSPAYFEDDDAGAPQLFFQGNNRPGGLGLGDLYMSELQTDGTWGPATWIPELNSSLTDERPSIRHDGLEIFFWSARPGGQGGNDLWAATRSTVDAPWSVPVNLGPTVNSSSAEQGPSLSSDNETLYFNSTRPGGFGASDLYMTTRSKERGHSADM